MKQVDCRGSEPGQDLECFREYLMLLARLHLPRRLQAKVDLSGVVQQALWEASRDMTSCRATEEQGKLAWLRSILAHHLGDEMRRFRTAARDVGREESIEDALDDSAARLDAWLVSQQTSPSQQAIRKERLLDLARALNQLPEDQRTAVELRYLRRLPVSGIMVEMGRTQSAVAGLLARGLKRLRQLLGACPNEVRPL